MREAKAFDVFLLVLLGLIWGSSFFNIKMDSVVLDDTFSKDTQPKEIKIPLKTHQLTLLKKCSELENSSHNPIILHDTENNTESELQSTFGIIGDIVGSGKTLTVLALIAKQNMGLLLQMELLLFI